MSQMGKFSGGLLGIPINTITGDVGGAVGPDAFSNVDLLGSSPITVTGNPAAWTLTITVDSATTVSEGVVELATDAESIAGTDTSRAIVPSSLLAKLGAMTANAVPYGAGTAAALSWTAAATDGQLIIGATGAAPAFADLASTGGTIAVTAGANSLDLDVGATVPTSFTCDAGAAVPALNVLTVAGAAGANISTSGAGSTVSIALSGTTQYALQVGDATGSLDSLAIGTASQVLQSAGAGANPAWSTTTYPVTTTQGDILYASANNTLSVLAKSATATRYLANTGAANSPAWDQVDLTNGVTGTLPVGNGGSGAATLTDHGVLVGSGTGAITALAVGTNGQVLVGSSAADPVFATIASADSTITVTGGAGTLDLATGSAVAKSFATDSGTATPSSGTITIAGGTNCNTAGSGSTVTINCTGGGSGMTWSEVTGTSQSAAVNYGYVCNNASLVTVTLPSTAAIGDLVACVGKGAGKFKLAQNAGQTTHFAGDSTTTGAGGSLTSDIQYGALEVVCITANTDFVVRHAVGNFTVV